jgi:hypothetical protein
MLVSAQVNETLEIGFDDQEGTVEITRWPEIVTKWSGWHPDAVLTLDRQEAVALRAYLNTIITERWP